MAHRDIVVIGGSSGAREPLRTILSSLPVDFPGTIFVVTHVPSSLPSRWPDLLQSSTALPIRHAVDGERIAAGKIYMAPPDCHLIIQRDHLRLGHGPRENMSRPSIDPLFRSAALAFGSRVVGVILSGLLNDGSSGLAAIKQRGGVTIVQTPDSAAEDSMPRAAMQATQIDHCLDASEMGPLLLALAQQDAPESKPATQELMLEVEIALGVRSDVRTTLELADPAPLTCPDCNGALSQVRDLHGPLRFRCQTGHAVTALVLDEQYKPLDEALRIALRIIEERAELTRRMAAEAHTAGREGLARLYAERHTEFARNADIIRDIVLSSMQRAGLRPEQYEEGRAVSVKETQSG
jgi:two-component system chemotaxis response regulator CheB